MIERTQEYHEVSNLIGTHGGIIDWYGYGTLFSDTETRPIRYLPHGEVQIGEVYGEFDRWANSVEFIFDLRKDNHMREFKRYLENFCKKA